MMIDRRQQTSRLLILEQQAALFQLGLLMRKINRVLVLLFYPSSAWLDHHKQRIQLRIYYKIVTYYHLKITKKE